MDPLPDTSIPDGELTVDDLDTVVHALRLLRRGIDRGETESPDPLLEHPEAYLARRERSEAVYRILVKVRRLRDELRRM